ncbi:MAG TPA: hypothetical protein VN679_03085 [Candidatus Acidoferrales bacterium]|nr:hypothetical protein [Candidatus Acidoferrales bacterium]
MENEMLGHHHHDEKKAALFIIGLIVCQFSAYANAACPLELEVSTGSAGRTTLDVRFALTYHGKKPIEIRESDLPSGALSMQVFQNDEKKTEVRRLGYISDPGPDRINLIPGHTYRGQINIIGRFYNIENIIKKNGVTVRWSYTLTPIHGSPLPTVNGVFVINRQQ